MTEATGTPGSKTRAELEQAIDGHIKAKASWGKWHGGLTLLHYSMGSISIALSTFAASGFISLVTDDYWKQLILLVSAITVALLTFWKPSERADRYRAAWALLGNQIDRYLAEEADAESVRRACEHGEAIVRFTAPVEMPGIRPGGDTPSPGPVQKPS